MYNELKYSDFSILHHFVSIIYFLPLIFHYSGTLSTLEYTVFQEWFGYLMSHEKPHIDLIGLQKVFCAVFTP